MAENKTRPTDVKPKDFIDAVEHDTRRADGHALLKMMQKATGQKPVMWGPSIVGFGTLRYRYESGREGEICRVGFSPRGSSLVLYIGRDFPKAQALMKKLGKHRDKGCLYINKLADVDTSVLEQLIAASWDHSLKTNP